MEVKVTFKYEIVYGEEVIECSSFKEAEKKLKSMRSCEIDGCYIVKKEYENKTLIEEWYVG
jgi:hypothetical protein